MKPEDAEEVVSMLFPEEFVDIDRFHNSEDFFQAMNRVVRNRIFYRMRANTAREENIAHVTRMDDKSFEAEDPDTQLLRAEDKQFVNEVLGRMEPERAMLLFLRDFDGLSYNEMGDKFGISEKEAIIGYLAARKQFGDLIHEEKERFEA